MHFFENSAEFSIKYVPVLRIKPFIMVHVFDVSAPEICYQ